MPVRYALVEDFWRQFHRIWGLNSTGFYDKEGWDHLRQTTDALFKEAGLERRHMARAVLRGMKPPADEHE